MCRQRQTLVVDFPMVSSTTTSTTNHRRWWWSTETICTLLLLLRPMPTKSTTLIVHPSFTMKTTSRFSQTIWWIPDRIEALTLMRRPTTWKDRRHQLTERRTTRHRQWSMGMLGERKKHLDLYRSKASSTRLAVPTAPKSMLSMIIICWCWTRIARRIFRAKTLKRKCLCSSKFRTIEMVSMSCVFRIESFLIFSILLDHNVLIKSLASVPGYFGEYLLFEVFETAVRFKLTPLLHKLRDSFPDKGDHLFRMYNLPTTSPEKLANIGATSKAASSNHSSVWVVCTSVVLYKFFVNRIA